MKKKAVNEKNSLEQFLIDSKKWFVENKTKTYQFVLVFLLVLAAILVVRANMGGSARKLNDVDAVYALADDVDTIKDATARYQNGEVGAEIQVKLGDSYLSLGSGEVQRKIANSRNASGDETAAALDPTVNFKAAVGAYEAAAAKGGAELKARAYYGVGVANESLAAVAASGEVDAAVEAAKAAYAKVAEVCANSPYAAPAAARLAALGKGLTVDYYKAVAEQFNTLPTATETPSILTGNTELTPGETPEVEDFDLNDDASSDEAAPAEDAAPTPETEAAPAE
ncbi:MAG: hypothetical protein HUK22_05870 [Thermoguttaceae bacterium]|nr:hypothetical protein [Thermoguttaceae bacterium]